MGAYKVIISSAVLTSAVVLRAVVPMLRMGQVLGTLALVLVPYVYLGLLYKLARPKLDSAATVAIGAASVAPCLSGVPVYIQHTWSTSNTQVEIR